jgi:hypothetical protein
MATESAESLVGFWRGTYGDGTLVSLTETPTGFVMASAEQFPKRLALHRIPTGSPVAQFRSTGGRTYAGVHGRWYQPSLRFARWSRLTLILDPSGTMLSGILADGGEHIVYRRAVAGAAPTSGQEPGRRPVGLTRL